MSASAVTPTEDVPLSVMLLAALHHEQTERGADEIALTRLSKTTGLGVSVLLREFTQLSDAVLGGQMGPSWVKVEQRDGRWLVGLTDKGLALLTHS